MTSNKAENNTNNRAKNWFITINNGAICFKDLDKIIQQETHCTYYLIYHDKDNIKQPHYHLVILYQNARSFNSMKNKYDGAHIEICNFPHYAIRYLIHKDNPEKEQYQVEEIRHNDIVQHLLDIMNESIKEPFDPNRIIEYYNEGCKTFLMFYTRFGENLTKHIQLVKSVLVELQELDRLQTYKEDNTPY